MDSNVLIVLIVVVGVIIVVFLLRDRLTKFHLGGSVEKKEADVSIEAAPKSSQMADPKYGVDIHGIKSVGTSEIDVRQTDTRVADVTSVGKSKIQVKDDKVTRK